MSSVVTDVGVNQPVGLNYLIHHQLLPRNADPSLYKWETFYDATQALASEELLITSKHVVWSRGRVIQRLFSLAEDEGQDILQATLTWFRTNDSSKAKPSQDTGPPQGSPDGVRSQTSPSKEQGNQRTQHASLDHDSHAEPHRALVILLPKQARIYLLHGSNHTVDLPFEVERAFPTPKGLLFQRKAHSDYRSPLSPVPPTAPPNSFLSPTRPSPTSPSPHPSQYSASRTFRVCSRPGKAPRSLDDFKFSLSQQSEDDMPLLFTLTDPLSSVGLAVEALPPSELQPSSLDDNVTTSETAAMSNDERIVYMSSANEISLPTSASARTKDRPLLLALTFNDLTKKYGIWYYAFQRPKSAATWRAHQAQARIKAERERSRSRPSFGQKLPAGRRSGARTSFARSFHDPHATQQSHGKHTRPSDLLQVEKTRKQEAPAASSQPLESPEKAKAANRRTSSMLARTELASQNQPGISEWNRNHQRTSNGHLRGGQSFGQLQHGRRSFRLSQVSTRTSIIGATDMEDDVSMQDDSVVSQGDHQSAAPTGYEDFYNLDLQDPFDDTRRDLMMRRVATLSTLDGASVKEGNSRPVLPPPSYRAKVFVIGEDKSHATVDHEDPSLSLAVFDPETHVLSRLLLRIQRVAVPDNDEGLIVPVLDKADVIHMKDVLDVEKIGEGETSGLVILRRDSSSASSKHGQRLYLCPSNALAVGTTQGILDISLIINLDIITRKRLWVPLPNIPTEEAAVQKGSVRPKSTANAQPVQEFEYALKNLQSLANPDSLGCVDLVDLDQTHLRIGVQLRPRDRYIDNIIDLCDFVLRNTSAGPQAALSTWRSVRSTVCAADGPNEWPSLVVTLFAFFVPYTTAYRESRSEAGFEPESAEPSTFLRDCIHRAQSFLLDDNAKCRSPLSIEKHESALTKSHLLSTMVVALHLLREEQTLNTGSRELTDPLHRTLLPVLAQLGHWLGWYEWSYDSDWYYKLSREAQINIASDDSYMGEEMIIGPPFDAPPSMHDWLSNTLNGSIELFPSLRTVVSDAASQGSVSDAQSEVVGILTEKLTPRSRIISEYLLDPRRKQDDARALIALSIRCAQESFGFESLPGGFASVVRNDMETLARVPSSGWPTSVLETVDRKDVALLKGAAHLPLTEETMREQHAPATDSKTISDVYGPRVYHDATEHDVGGKTMLNLVFRQNTAFLSAQKLLHSHISPIAVLHSHPGTTETQFLEAERAHAQLIGIRSLAITTGTALLGYQEKRPLPVEELEIGLWETQVRMMPSGHIMTLSRENFTEPKSAWAAYHTGVMAGLQIEHDVPGLDPSWICLNKPPEPHNRHAGLMLGLGLNGYLRTMPRWLVFKYLTPKHEMTSVSVLLGLAASHLGTMNTLVIKVLSIHLVSLLPPGAAELNLSSLVQTSGIMGVGLLYYDTHHRRMSEVLLSELEFVDREDPYDAPTKFVRDEGYRLATGFALGLVNIAQGTDMRTLQDLRVEERLVALATGPKDVSIVNIADQATAGATMALALIYMKTGNKSLARKIDAPSARPQFDYVRPDILLLRVVAKNLILWDEIEASDAWICESLPADVHEKVMDWSTPTERAAYLTGTQARGRKFRSRLRSTNLHLYSIVAGLCWSIGLKSAGTGDKQARDLILLYYDAMNALNEQPLSYDEHLVCSTLLRLQHLLLLAAATVMSGTGDLYVLRRARILHGTVNEQSTFGLHQAAHMVIGALFLGRGRFAFSTSNLAIASLLCAFYPLFPKEVMDNKAHLQAFRHLWVFASEPRCVFPRDVETKKVVIMPIEVTLKDGTTRQLEAPTLLHPSLDAISSVRTLSEEHWPVTLDFTNPAHIHAFRQNQSIWLQKRSLPAEHNNDPYDTALAFKRTNVIDTSSHRKTPEHQLVRNILASPIFEGTGITRPELESIFPRRSEGQSSSLPRSQTNEHPDPQHKDKHARAERKKQTESELLRAMPTLAQAYAPPKRDDSATTAADTTTPDDKIADDGVANQPPLESLLDIRTTKVDDALNFYAAARSSDGRKRRELDLLFEMPAEERRGWVSDEIVEALRGKVVGREMGLEGWFGGLLGGYEDDDGDEEEEVGRNGDGMRFDGVDEGDEMDVEL